MDTLSLDASIAITGISRSTLWRRVTDGSIGRGDKDGRSRAMLALGDVLPLVEVKLSAEDRAMLLRADAGDAEAQADMGALFYVAGAHKAALYWLQEAAAQDNADAMQWLGTAYAAGSGGGGVIPQDDNLAIMWLARAAALGHRIAAYQLEQLRAGCR
ncbi:sel1 repeat family protein [Diaphorobacter limosus]|uniref:Sel1 repeat family protein n=1 Tax=Diaphorobacter limosus TaxID=3036128 RepID=A0ABZ0J788_9BURK|nr:sel1 repeat family protein [Diaphorobacter sp. Y-1]WOO34051.1 sel1 repeat family protein [Diaphorobacter sp. Y-1]